jgi:hypothetical protein
MTLRIRKATPKRFPRRHHNVDGLPVLNHQTL